jgi:uncharacterized protein with NRDE domain
LILNYKTCEDAPVLLAANREEYFDRRSRPPRLHAGTPPVVCGSDERAGGTWLGANGAGVVVAVTNRPKSSPPKRPRSRGLLCRELLTLGSAQAGAELAESELASGQYDGANFLCADRHSAHVVCGGDELSRHDLSPGQYLLANGSLDDPRDGRIKVARSQFSDRHADSIDNFLDLAQRVLSLNADQSEPPIVVREEHRGTVSSSICAIANDLSRSKYLYADGAPDRCEYEDFSDLLWQALGAS